MADCFICLNKSTNRVCSTCKCFAHPKCWGEYLQNSTEVYTYVFPNQVVISTPLGLQCPQCRQNINNIKPITRSDTIFARSIVIVNNYNNILLAADLLSTFEEKWDIFDILFDGLLENKGLIVKEAEYLTVLSNKLKELYTLYDWKKANLYHLELIGTQILVS